MENTGLSQSGKMTADGILAVLFADISGSTSLYESLGNQVAQKIVADCLQRLGQVARQHLLGQLEAGRTHEEDQQ